MDINQAAEELSAAIIDHERTFEVSLSEIEDLFSQKPPQLKAIQLLITKAELAARRSCESELDLGQLLDRANWTKHKDEGFVEPEMLLQTRVQQLKTLKQALIPQILQHSIRHKLITYLLNDKSHKKEARDKAAWFAKALGFSLANVDKLEQQIKLEFTRTIHRRRQTQYGDSFSQIIPIIGANGRTIPVEFVWQVDSEGYLYLITSILGVRRNVQ